MIHVPVQTTPLQEHMIDAIVFIMKCWKNSNDLLSPTVRSDIDEELRKFTYDKLDPDYLETVGNRVSDILDLIIYADHNIEETV